MSLTGKHSVVEGRLAVVAGVGKLGLVVVVEVEDGRQVLEVLQGKPEVEEQPG